MRVLLVGGGGREHALAWKFARDDPTLELIAAPGNAGLAEVGRCLPVAGTDTGALLEVARRERIDCTVVGPEAVLAAGLVDRFREARLPVFGPTQAAAAIESSKSFAKRLMLERGVPTASAEIHRDSLSAKRAVRRFGSPVVIKASGLAAGKGAIVCGSIEEAESAIDAMLLHRRFGPAGDEVLVEEFMEGEELSVLALTDGVSVLPMLPAQDYKRLLAGDLGPNTGGMGAYAPVSTVSPALMADIITRIIEPTLGALREGGAPFEGVLYAGIMVTSEGPKVVEFNCRFGDPETEALLPLLDSDLLPVLHAIARGDRIDGATLGWSDRYSVTTVVAAPGYPEAPRTGARIELPALPDDILVFHAGTARADDGTLVTAGGRVFAVTAVADSFADAQGASAAAASAIGFDGAQHRRDIGWRELERHARASRS